ncbi:MAG: DUF5691 domain-containing protein [Phycisphaerales bacterium JB039]
MSAAEAMDRLTALALLGVRASGLESVGAPARAAALAQGLQPAEGALALGAALSQCQRAGGVPRTGGVERVAGPKDDGPGGEAGAAAALRRALQTDELLGECLDVLAIRRLAAPPELVPALLDLARRSRRLRDRIAPVLGERGRWLASMRPQWGRLFIDDTLSAEQAEDVWGTGAIEERRAVLRALRDQDAEAGRALVESTWKEDSPIERARFVDDLRTGLGLADEPLLEQCLRERRKEVREAAAALLALMPESAYVSRMTERGLAAVHRALGRKLRLKINLPDESDTVLKREAPRVPFRSSRGERGRLLEAIISVPPPRLWLEHLGAEPPDIIAAAAASDWAEPIVHGLITASERHADRDWASALLAARPKLSEVAGANEIARMVGTLGSEQTEVIAESIARSKDSEWIVLLMQGLPSAWDDRLSAAALGALAPLLRKARRTQIYRDNPLWMCARIAALHSTSQRLAALRSIIEDLADESPAFRDILFLLDQRERMLEEFSRDD